MVDAHAAIREEALQDLSAAQGWLEGEGRESALPGLDELARRAAEGDRVAFEAIYDAMARDIFEYLAGSTRQLAVSEDLAANVFLKAWRSAKTYRVGSNTYRRWLFAIARNELNNHWRTNRTDIPIDLVDLAETDPGAVSRQEEDLRERVLDAMQFLTAEQRDVIVLRYYREKSYAEIAELLGKREGAIRALVMRGLRQLRRVIDDAQA